jgi:predicted amidohydrolase YtcJ
MPMTRRQFLRATAAAGFAAGSARLITGCGSSPAPGNATLLENGAIYVDASSRVSSLVVRDGRVVAADANPADWPGAERVDLGGAALFPGFTDSHMHLMETGIFERVGIGVFGTRNGREVADALAPHVHPDLRVVFAAGFNPPDYGAWSLQDLAALDEVTGERVAIVFDRLGHNCAVNSFTMRKFDTATRPVPYGGTVVTEGGRQTGMFREAAMTMVGTDVFAEFDDADVKAGTEALALRWARKGWTGLVDLMGATGLQLMRPHLLRELEQEGKLPLRVHYCHTVLRLEDVDVAASYRGQDTDRVRFVGGKLFVDGAFAGGQAWTSWPHLNPAGSFGVPQITTNDAEAPSLNVNHIVARAEALGLNMHYHVQGDRAIKAVLDALDGVLLDTGRIGGIHTLIHLAYPTEALVARVNSLNARAGALRVVATTQPGFWDVEADTTQYYGDRAWEAYPVKMLVDSGVSVGFSTDFAVSLERYCPPTSIIQLAATGGRYAEHHPAVTVQDAIQALSMGSARTTGSADVGTLHLGQKADMVVYEEDLHRVPPGEMTENYPAVLSTWVGGRRVT